MVWQCLSLELYAHEVAQTVKLLSLSIFWLGPPWRKKSYFNSVLHAQTWTDNLVGIKAFDFETNLYSHAALMFSNFCSGGTCESTCL